MNFSATGSATGPYPGQFINTNASGGVSGVQKPGYEQLHVSIPFTITSVTSAGTTTITGTITNPYPWIGGSYICNGAAALVGFSAGGLANHATYTATIQAPGQPAQTIGGNVQLRGNFYIQKGVQTTVTETLTFP